MEIDLRTVSIQPLRHTFDHIAARFGDKPASRYQEGTYNLQAEANFHYRPLWDSEHEIYDVTRTALVMEDWYAFKDPRQFYYGTYTLARAKMQDIAESDFEFVESRGLLSALSDIDLEKIQNVFLPLRHVAWGSNMNNSFISAYGYGTAITQPCLYHAMDQLGIAQYITRMGLLIGDVSDLDVAKKAWLDESVWQPLRKYIEDSFVLKDWFELLVAQNFVLDGLLYPLIYQSFDSAFSTKAGPAISMLTRFQSEWFSETGKWVDSTIKISTSESEANQQLISKWVEKYLALAIDAIIPIAHLAFGPTAGEVVSELVESFNQRAAKLGIKK